MTNDDVLSVQALLEQVRVHHQTWGGPLKGSELRDDDKAWPYYPPSEVARSGIVSALDHLYLVGQVLDEGSNVPPYATQSLIRGALVGSCQALWILTPEDQAVRRARALRLAHEEYRYREAFHESQKKSADADRAAHSVPWAAKWRARGDELSRIRAELPEVKYSTTGVMQWVAEEVLSEEDDPKARLMGLWQSTSSSAHGFTWGIFVRPGVTPVAHDAERGLTSFSVDVNADDIFDAFVFCATLVVRAEELLRSRSMPHAAGQ